MSAMQTSQSGCRVRRLLRRFLTERLEWAVLGFILVASGQARSDFLAPLAFDVGVFPFSVAVGDFNGDGHLDLAVANIDSNDVSVLLGNGDGRFQPARSFSAGSGTY